MATAIYQVPENMAVWDFELPDVWVSQAKYFTECPGAEPDLESIARWMKDVLGPQRRERFVILWGNRGSGRAIESVVETPFAPYIEEARLQVHGFPIREVLWAFFDRFTPKDGETAWLFSVKEVVRFLSIRKNEIIRVLLKLAAMRSSKNTFQVEQRFFQYHGTGRPPKIEQVLSMDLVPA
jgi:hypothetical protein